jgi:hypothetical protein
MTYSYEGDRTREDIVNFATRVVGPAVNQIESKADFDSAKKRSDILFLFSGQKSGSEWVSKNSSKCGVYSKIGCPLFEYFFWKIIYYSNIF